MNAVDRKLAEDVRRHGWGVIMIPEDDISAGWAFTAGLWHTFRVPEVAMFGLDTAEMHAMLNAVGEEVRAGRAPAAGDRVEGVLDGGYRVLFADVREEWRPVFFGTALRFYRDTPDVPFLQCLWPDREGRFPGEEGFPDDLDDLQPRLWLDRADHPEGPWTDPEA
ncbi:MULTISPECIES: DUF4262 domain-containing protein [unclassified Saccharothrix]|uniref:DUF4262 domain-containing protein n=1 Tax=unclassified Saccharothrix TaxID=2593673 RepID=UPI00307DEB06